MESLSWNIKHDKTEGGRKSDGRNDTEACNLKLTPGHGVFYDIKWKPCEVYKLRFRNASEFEEAEKQAYIK